MSAGIQAAPSSAALRALREFSTGDAYKPLLTLGDGEDCSVVRNAAAMLTVIAATLEGPPTGQLNPEITRHAIEGVAELLYLRAFAERAA